MIKIRSSGTSCTRKNLLTKPSYITIKSKKQKSENKLIYNNYTRNEVTPPNMIIKIESNIL